MKNNISVVLATYNEENNLRDCLESVKEIADEIIIVDGSSTDRTVEIANSFNAKVIVKDNPPIFHINKQIALEKAKGEWILQLDADERVSSKLAQEIKKVINMNDKQVEEYQSNLPNKKIFLKHQNLVNERDGIIGKDDAPYHAFFVPRLNYFLGRYLRFGGVYPDGVIRLVRRGKARFPCVSVHEQIEVDGRVGWLSQDLMHYDSPTFSRYLARNKRYIMLLAGEIKKSKQSEIDKFISNVLILPLSWFFMTYFRHKGFLDSWQGLVFSFFSSIRFPRAYFIYIKNKI